MVTTCYSCSPHGIVAGAPLDPPDGEPCQCRDTYLDKQYTDPDCVSIGRQL